MADLKLLEDEVVILKELNVYDEHNNSVELVLTNFNLIEVVTVYGFWNRSETTNKYPLLDLKDQNGKPNVIVGKNSQGKKCLELYFSSFSKSFVFQGWFSIGKWQDAIEKAYQHIVSEQTPHEDGVNKVFNSIKDGIANGLSAVKNVTPLAKPKLKKVNKCPKCGAELSGEKGAEVVCEYCNTVIRIK